VFSKIADPHRPDILESFPDFAHSSKIECILNEGDAVFSLGDPMHYILQARVLESITFRFSRVLPNPGIEPRSPALQQIVYQLSHKGNPT